MTAHNLLDAKPPRCTWRPMLFLLLLTLLATAREARADNKLHQQQQQEVHARMNEMVDSVKEAVREADAAGDKKEVVDLGQSLSLLESKFSGLRAALAQELGVSAEKMAGQTTTARELMEKSTELVKSVVSQREELRRLSTDLRETDSAIRALREGLDKFEREMSNLNRIMGDVHQSQNEISASHDEIKGRVSAVIQGHGKASRVSSWHWMMYVLLVGEMVAFGAFCYLKRPGRATVHKVYGKFG